MKKYIILSLTILSMLVYSRCGDEFLNKVDETSINSGSFYTSEGDAIASVNAAYAHLQNISLWGRRIFFMLDFSSDEIGRTPNTQGPPLELLLHTFGPQGNEHIDNPWQMFYKLIARTNITISEVSEMEDIDQTVQNQVLGQAYFLRALGYFYINTLWNGGPLRTEETIDLDISRATPEEIWQLIESDLDFASKNLPAEWAGGDAGRATSGAALALLGKSHLYQEDWAAAESALMQVINSGVYHLVGGEDSPNPATTIDEAIAAMRTNHDFGVKNNAEAVFEVQFKAGEGGLSWDSNNATGRREATVRPQEYGVDGFSFYNAKPSQKLIDAFERINPDSNEKGNIDPRFQAFFFTEYDTLLKGEEKIPYSDILATAGYAWKKYQHSETVQNPANASDNDVNHDIIRYADVLLMAAEAKINQNKVAEGIDLINQVRKRADPTSTILPLRPTATTAEEALDYLIQERQIELAGEQVRRSDLVRWGLAAENLDGFQVGKHEFFPIPQNEIDANAEISIQDQNPNYN
ncbi:MAG: RagB/SusD family nutrient uptake outer membrane protein [Candidatus Cyclobacteriaceae bacterium M3_2C_046]